MIWKRPPSNFHILEVSKQHRARIGKFIILCAQPSSVTCQARTRVAYSETKPPNVNWSSAASELFCKNERISNAAKIFHSQRRKDPPMLSSWGQAASPVCNSSPAPLLLEGLLATGTAGKRDQADVKAHCLGAGRYFLCQRNPSCYQQHNRQHCIHNNPKRKRCCLTVATALPKLRACK